MSKLTYDELKEFCAMLLGEVEELESELQTYYEKDQKAYSKKRRYYEKKVGTGQRVERTFNHKVGQRFR